VPSTTASPGRTYRGQTGAGRREDRRQRLLKAGFDLYGVEGFGQVSIEALCREAGITARHFYEAFPTQVDLFTEVYAGVIDEAEAHATQVVAEQGAGLSPTELVRLGLGATFHHLHDEPRRARIVCLEARKIPTGASLGLFGMGRLTDIVERFFFEHLAAHATLEVDGRLLASAVAGAVLELLTVGLDPDRTGPIDELIDLAVFVACRTTGLA
jgi:AcrR family transcriptional regulator